MIDSATVQSLLAAFRMLTPWHYDQDFTAEDWMHYIDAGSLVQASESVNVEHALARFLDEADGFTEVENETRLFLLMRVVFDLPNCAPVDQRHVFKGWINWPTPDTEGNVNLSWPVDWQDSQPALLAHFEGADGPRYAAVEEYRYLLAHFPLRRLQAAKG